MNFLLLVNETGAFAWWELLVWLLVVWIAIWMLRPLASAMHELGHAIPALFFTSAVVEIQVGKFTRTRGNEKTKEMPCEVARWRTIGRLHWACRFPGSFQGFTGYDRQDLSRAGLLIVIAGGPFVSGCVIALALWLGIEFFNETWQRMLIVAFLCSNTIVFLRAVIPVELRDGSPSDGLDFLRTWSKKDR